MKVFSAFLKRHTKLVIIISSFVVMTLLVFISSFSLNFSERPLSYAVYDKNGYLIGAKVAEDEQWRFEAADVPEKFEKAVVTFEDKRFYMHFGVDPLSLARSLFLNVTNKRIVSGGSTITMQTIRLIENHPKRTIFQKMKEAVLAVSVEMRFSKKEIITLYAANAPFGGNVVGLEAASWRYFNRPPEKLTWAESATLAVLPNQPALVYPGANKEILLSKRNALLKKLFENGILNEQVYALSLEEELPEKPYALPSLSYHYLESLIAKSKKESSSKGKRKTAKSKFYTSLDTNIQSNTTRILERWSQNFRKRGIENAAAIVLDTKSGDILAYCGNTGGFEKNPGNYAVDLVVSKRSSGSILKPFLYAAMLDSGQLLPNQLVIDIPTRIGSYRPGNNIPEYQGVIQASQALSRSLNIPAVRELRTYGLNAFLAYLEKCGFTTFDRPAEEYGLPLILGGGETTLEEAVRAYAKLMNKAQGLDVDFPASVGSAYITVDVLANGTRPLEEANWQRYAHSKRIAWKTGTSSGNRDTWAIGTTPEYTVGVWIGNADGHGSPDLRSFMTSAPVLFDLFSVLERTSWVTAPYSSLKQVEVCSHSGYLASSNCSSVKTEFVPKNAPSVSVCPYCRIVSLSPDMKHQATTDDLAGGVLPVIQKRFVLQPSIEHWYRKININYQPLPPFVENHKKSTENDLAIIFPEPNAHVIIPVEIDGKPGAMVMQAACRDMNKTVYWDLDGEFLGTTQEIHDLAITPKPGNHTLTLSDSTGTVVTRKFTVVGEEEE
ncbi:MAG: penicillin-binding protein 1C [Treponema sp.]|nr:penicillin-binding protein 1C [Treponema sp.]